MNKHIIDTDDTDHTFSFISAEEMATSSPVVVDLAKENDDLRDRLQACGEIMIPFMRALCREPDKAFIKWPGRVKILEEQIERITKLITVEPDIDPEEEQSID
jgi:hypothetical protein